MVSKAYDCKPIYYKLVDNNAYETYNFCMRRVFVFLLLFVAGTSFCEESQRLDRIVVTPSRLRTHLSESSRTISVLDDNLFKFSSSRAIADTIGSVGGIDMRRRGVEGIQADINIRGATFEQNMILIDGVRLTDPQTGHFSMDLPLGMSEVERIEILKGPASSIYGPNAMGGAINIITKKYEKPEIVLQAEGGYFDFISGGISVSMPFGPVRNRFSFEEARSGGYMPETDFNIISLSNRSDIDTAFGEYSFLFGYAKKDFGADSFYSNLFNSEEEHTDTRFFKIDGRLEVESIKIDPVIFLRRHWDKFALDRNRPGWQTNYHTTYVYGAGLNIVMENPFSDVAYGVEISQDTIDSTSMQKHDRGQFAIFAEISPHITEKIHMNIGFREDVFSGFGWEFSPSISLSYDINENLVLRSSIGRAYRIPTFTDLYYNDAANKGYSGLKPESSWSYEAGADIWLKWTRLSTVFFHRNTQDTIDWIRFNSRSAWQAANIGSVKTNGAEVSLHIDPRQVTRDVPVEDIFLNYTILDSYNKHDYFSKYALEYLKQHVSAGVEIVILDFSNSWVLNYKKRAGDSGFFVLDTKIAKKVFSKGRASMEIFFQISNVFDVEYSEQSDVNMPGRWIKSGGTIKF